MKLEAYQYEVEICDSALDMVHGLKYKISEIYVEEFHLAFNSKGGIFQTEEPRAKKTKKIEVAKEDVVLFLDYLIQKSACENTLRLYFPKLEKIL